MSDGKALPKDRFYRAPAGTATASISSAAGKQTAEAGERPRPQLAANMVSPGYESQMPEAKPALPGIVVSQAQISANGTTLPAGSSNTLNFFFDTTPSDPAVATPVITGLPAVITVGDAEENMPTSSSVTALIDQTSATLFVAKDAVGAAVLFRQLVTDSDARGDAASSSSIIILREALRSAGQHVP